jgi:CDP-diacylglycerol--glycerol-3-phosphate 3-phosphatidyltransferase
MRHVPIALIYSRLFIGVFLFVFSFLHWQHFNVLAIVLFAAGLLSDIFDGIIARRLGVSTQKMRRLDSLIDQIFWCLTAAAAFVQCPQFFYDNYIKLAILLSVEALTYLVSFIKFKKKLPHMPSPPKFGFCYYLPRLCR